MLGEAVILAAMAGHADTPPGLARAQPGIVAPLLGLVGVLDIVDKGGRIALPGIADGLHGLAAPAERLEHLPALVDHARGQEAQGARIGHARNRGGGGLADRLGQEGRAPAGIEHQDLQPGLAEQARGPSARSACAYDNRIETCRAFQHRAGGTRRYFAQDLVWAGHGFQLLHWHRVCSFCCNVQRPCQHA